MADPEPIAEAVIAGCELGDSAEQLAHEFLEQRPRLLGIAYRLLGTMWDAEDIVADAMVRWLAVDREQVREPCCVPDDDGDPTGAGPASVRSRRPRDATRGEWLPEPIGTSPSPLDPLDTVERRESVSLATLRMMEQLTPPERAVFVLHEAFDVPHATIADVLDISPDSSRQHLHRARVHIERGDRRFDPDSAAHGTLFERFLGALEAGDLDELQDVLAERRRRLQRRWWQGTRRPPSDRRAPTRSIAFFGALRRHHAIEVDRRIEVNGQPGHSLWFGRQYQLLTVDLRGTRSGRSTRS